MRWLKEKIKQWLVKEVLREEIQKLNQAQACYNRASCLCEESLENNREMKKNVQRDYRCGSRCQF